MGEPASKSMSAIVTKAKAKRSHRNAELSTTLQLTCEATRKQFAYDVPGDGDTLKNLWPHRLVLSCPHCGQVHGFQFRTVYVQALVADPRLPSETISRAPF